MHMYEGECIRTGHNSMGLAPESMDNFNHAYTPILEGRDHDSGLLLERD